MQSEVDEFLVYWFKMHVLFVSNIQNILGMEDIFVVLCLTLINYFSYAKFHFRFWANICMLLLHSVYVA